MCSSANSSYFDLSLYISRLINALEPGTVKKINTMKAPFKQVDWFLNALFGRADILSLSLFRIVYRSARLLVLCRNDNDRMAVAIHS